MTQEQQILAHLKAGHRLTRLEALTRFGCIHIGARVFDLRKAGWDIRTERVKTKTGKRVVEYYLHRTGEQTKMKFTNPPTIDRREAN
jgi:hypothetical protein